MSGTKINICIHISLVSFLPRYEQCHQLREDIPAVYTLMNVDLIHPLVIGQDDYENSEEANLTDTCNGSRSDCYHGNVEYPFKPPLTTIAGTL